MPYATAVAMDLRRACFMTLLYDPPIDQLAEGPAVTTA